MKVFILQEKHDYQSNPEVINIYENEYDALLAIDKLKYSNKRCQYQITEKYIIQSTLNNETTAQIEYENRLIENQKIDLENKITYTNTFRDNYNEELKNFRSKVAILSERDKSSKQIIQEINHFKNRISNISHDIWDLIDDETYDLLY